MSNPDAPKKAGLNVVPTPQVQQVQRILRTLLEEPTAENHALAVAVMAPSGWGKTSVVRDFLIREQNRRVGDLKYAVVALPANATPKNLASRTLDELGDPAPTHGNAADMTRRITGLLKKGRYDVLVFDDVNNISDGDSATKRRQGARWIEEILNTSETPIIMTARDEFRAVISENEFLERRLRTVPRLRGLEWSDKDEFSHFRYVLGQFESAAGMAAQVAASDGRIARRLCIATKGLLGHLDILIKDAVRLAKSRQMGSLSWEILKQVTSQRLAMSARGMRNPFEVEETDLLLVFGTESGG